MRAGHFHGGNSIDDVRKLAERGPAWLEMDFRLNNQGLLLSGHDEDTYAKFGGPLMTEIVDPREVRNRRGGQCTTLRGVLEEMAPRSRLFIDLKNTWYPSQAEAAVNAAIRDVEATGRRDDAVIMVYTRHAHLCSQPQTNMSFCLKQINNRYSEDETLRFVSLAAEFGAKYMCCPIPSSYTRFAPACREAGILPIIVPVGEKDAKPSEILQHLENGVRHFICNLNMKLLNAVYSAFLEKREKIGRATEAVTATW